MSNIDYSAETDPRARYSRVSIAESLVVADEWEQVPHLYCSRLIENAGPGMSSATLTWDCGNFAHYFGEDNVERQPYVLDRLYVKVEILSPPPDPDPTTVTDPMAENPPVVEYTWFGSVEFDEMQGPSSGYPPNGLQVFTAYGLMRDLESTIVDTAVIALDPSSETESERTQRIPRGLVFNPVNTVDLPGLGNQYYAPIEIDGRSSWVFQAERWDSADEETEDQKPYQWDAYTAIDHLLTHHTPTTVDGEPACLWELDGTEDPFANSHPLSIVAWYKINNIPTDRRNLKEIIDDLVDRRRFVGWCVEGDDSGEEFVARIRLFSFSDHDIQLVDRAQKIAENEDQALLTLLDKVEVTDLQVSNNGLQRYDEVVAEGDFITSTISIYVAPDTEEAEAGLPFVLTPGWTDEQKQAYLDAASEAEGYDELDAESKYQLNASVRAGDHLRDVFAKFVMDESWHAAPRVFEDYKVTVDEDGLAALTANNVAEIFASDSEYEQDALWTRGARFLRYLPTVDNVPVEPFLLWVVNRDASPTVVQYGEQLNADESRSFSVGLEILDDDLGIRMRVGLAGGQHMIAKDDWTDAAETPDSLIPTDDDNNALHYRGEEGEINFRAIVALPWDRRVSASETLSSQNLNAVKRVRRIYVPDARLDIRIPWTSKGINSSGHSDTDEEGTLIRDDRERLKAIAKAAKEWYGVQRQAMLLSYGKLTLKIRPAVEGTTNPDPIRLGTLITKIGLLVSKPDINSPVTSISFDLEQQRTSIQTTFYEGDFV